MWNSEPVWNGEGDGESSKVWHSVRLCGLRVLTLTGGEALGMEGVAAAGEAVQHAEERAHHGDLRL